MFAERIKKLRKILELSVPKLSKKIDIPERTIVSYEGGRIPSMEFLTQLCKIYNVNANWFVTGEGEMFNKKEPAGLKDEIKQAVREMIAAGELKDEFK